MVGASEISFVFLSMKEIKGLDMGAEGRVCAYLMNTSIVANLSE